MKSFRKELCFNTKARIEYLNITNQVMSAIRESGVKEGMCLVNSMHISSSVFINDDERGLHQDFTAWLEKYVPYGPIEQYRHNDTGEDNADSHIRRQLFGREVVVAITDGSLDFGPW